MISKSKNILIYVTILLGVVTTYNGLIDINFVTKITSISLDVYYFKLTILVALIEVIRKKLKVSYIITGLSVIGLLSVSTDTIWPLFIVVGFFLSSYVLGHYFLKVINISRQNALISTLAGVIFYGSIVSILVHFPVNYPGTYGLAILTPIVLGRNIIINTLSSFFRNMPFVKKTDWLSLSILVFIVIYVLIVLMPEVRNDALAMHLFIPHHVFYNHEWGFDVGKYVWAVMPTMGDWIYSFVYMLGGETSVRLINFSFILILSRLTYELVLWIKGNETGAKWAVLILLSSPLTLLESSSVFIEPIWSVFVVAGVMMVMKLMLINHTNNKNYLIISAILLGGALATKAVTFMALPVLLVLLIFYYKSWLLNMRMGALTLSVVIFLLIGGMPYLNAYIITDNPVFPFFNEFFQSAQYPVVNFSASAFFEKGVTWDTIYRITFDSGKYLESNPGAGGFQWLLLLLPSLIFIILTINQRGLWLAFIALISIILIFQQTAYLRYIYPFYTILIVLIGLFVSSIVSSSSKKLRITVVIASAIVILLNILYIKSAAGYASINLPVLTSVKQKDNYLSSRIPLRSTVKFVNEINTKNDPVAVFSSPHMAGLNADALYVNWYNHKFRDSVSSAKNEAELAEVLKQNKVKYILIDNSWKHSKRSALVTKISKQVHSIGTISIRTIKQKFLWNHELITNPLFLDLKSWQHSKDSEDILTKEGVIASVDYSIVQSVKVEPGERYLLKVSSKCLDSIPTTFRLQINWKDENGKFVSTYIKVFNCTKKLGTISRIIVSPNNAKHAVVYATGHTKTPVIINNISLRK
jgi:hypothetical protein